MAQFARPASDVAFSMLGATPTNTAGDRYTNIDESSPSDTDYVYSQNNPGGSGNAEFGLSAVTDPGVDTGHVLRIRHAQIDEDSGSHPMGANTGGTATSLAWELRQGATVIQSDSVSPGAFTTTTVNLTDTNVANITDYSDLRIFINPTGGGGSPASRRGVAVSWIELETPDASAETSANAEHASAAGAASGGSDAIELGSEAPVSTAEAFNATAEGDAVVETIVYAWPAYGIGHI